MWEDLVEIDPEPVELWKQLADGFLTWCRRGVDGFRCDAGYKVPLPVWRFITAKVRREFPGTVFLLEGLGGGWDDTETRLTEGGMQWAYSELFQEFSSSQVAGYLDHALKQGNRIGPLVHYSETHDNDRLAKRGRNWSLLRNRLSALASVNGGYGFTCGVEWLAEQKINVHGCAGLNWGADENIVAELAQLNELLATHPCFRDGTKLTRLSPDDSPVFTLLRESKNGDELLILANLDPEKENEIELALPSAWHQSTDLLAQAQTGSARAPACRLGRPAQGSFIELPPNDSGGAPESTREARVLPATYRLAKAAVHCLQHSKPKPTLPPIPAHLLQSIDSGIHSDAYPKVIRWTVSNANRVTMIPAGHDLLIEHDTPFRVALNDTDPDCDSINRQSQRVNDGHFVLIDGYCRNETYNMELTSFGGKVSRLSSVIEFLPYEPDVFPAYFDSVLADCRQLPMLLLTNGCGAMSRMSAWLGEVQSKYDCVLAANLHSSLPVDRWVMVKRLRAWVSVNGCQTELGHVRLRSVGQGNRTWWSYKVRSGNGRIIWLDIAAQMLRGQNAIQFCFEADAAVQSEEIEMTVRLDVEDRSFHGETKLDAEAEKHFREATRPLADGVGFEFAPSSERRLVARATCGRFFVEEQWCRDIPHPVEAARGQEASGDAFSPGWFQLPIESGQATELTVSINESDTQPLGQVENSDEDDDTEDEDDWDAGWPRLGPAMNEAMDAFVVQRGEAKSIIAGYPWFLDWGRDSLIAVRGLIAAGRLDEARAVVGLFASHEKDGTIPNAIFGDNDSNRETSDAPLWLALAIEELAAKLGEDFYAQKVGKGSRTFLSVIKSIGENYSDGTPNGIRMDAESSLVFSPVHFTWMDTNHPAGTQREGYPVEIQALWIRLLSHLAKLDPGGEWSSRLAKAEQSFVDLFWCDERGWLADCLLAKPGQSAAEATTDANLRCNILIAVSLGVVSGSIARANVDAAARHLLVPGAVRSLAPLPALTPHEVRHNGELLNDPANPYWGRYEGDEDTRRKPAYHNGTAWTWFLPQFCEALVRAWPSDPDAVEAAKGYLCSVADLMNDGCLGQLPELLDGDAPHRQRGCDAQAWGVSEALRVWHLLDK
ncbi:MAG: putative glycogen debranching enzyme [Limisphaerales bacterium]